MGREVRRVPPHWAHPRDSQGKYLPMLDRNYDDVAQSWLKECIDWSQGTHDAQKRDHGKNCKYFWEWNGNPPDIDYFRPYKDEEATWFQVYETVSEGTPITPPFETKEELVEYLVKYGDFWKQKQGGGGYSREIAEKFVLETEYAPSAMITSNKAFLGIESVKLL